MPGGDTSNGQSGAVAPPSSTFHQIPPPKYLDLKHSGEIAENWKLWKGKYNNYFVISRLDREKFRSFSWRCSNIRSEMMR